MTLFIMGSILIVSTIHTMYIAKKDKVESTLIIQNSKYQKFYNITVV